jgi:hypothetical protein
VNEAVVASLVTLLDRVRERSRSSWPALVDAHPDDEARGHAAFAELEAGEGAHDAGEPFDDDVLVESSPRIRLMPRAGSVAPPAPPAVQEPDDAPMLEVLGERPLGDVAEALVAEAMPLLEHVTLGELLEASLALRPRADAW